MLLKSSSFYNDSSPAPNLYSLTSISLRTVQCFTSSHSSLFFIGFNFTNILLHMPLCLLILYYGIKQWWLKRSSFSTATSHSDILTFHVVVLDLIGVSGCLLGCCGIYTDNFIIILSGSLLWFFCWYGESLFHTLTCLEHYLAAVHPVIYMRLRNERGIRIRNVSIGCAWLLPCMGMATLMKESLFTFLNLCVLAVTLLLVFFCCLSVLCVLIRPGPGEQGGTRERVDQTKKRAFHTIAAIFGALSLRFIGGLLWMIVYLAELNSACFIFATVAWSTIPSSLVLPLLFLHRAGKLMCCKNI